MKARIAALVLALGIIGAGAALADGPSPDPIGDAVLPPDFVMTHAQELGLSDQQKTAIVGFVQHAQERFKVAQPQMQAAVGKLASMLQQPHIDESKALAQLDVELASEREIKRTQILVMIQVKNELTPDQQAKAYSLKHGAQ